jgi:hypothetical protein
MKVGELIGRNLLVNFIRVQVPVLESAMASPIYAAKYSSTSMSIVEILGEAL